MKIKENVIEPTTFSGLAAGDVFRWQLDVWMKVKPTESFNAVRLHDGANGKFTDHKIRPLEVELVIKG